MKLFFLAPAVIALLALGAYACSDDGTAAPATDYAPLLANIANNVILPANTDFAAKADAFVAAAKNLEATPSADTFGKAQDAWRAARLAWRKLDAFAFGPMTDDQLPARIDVYPATPADIDAVVNGTATIDLAAVSALGGKKKGFLGTEYLLFTKTAADLTGDGAPARRRSLVRYEAEEIAQTAHQLADAWAPTGGNYVNEVLTAGKGSARYGSQRAALDDLVAGVQFALENVVGVFLAEPLGRKSSGTPDATKVVTAASDSTAADIAGSLAGARAVYDGQGLSSRVRTSSAALDTTMTTQFGDCASKVSGLSTPFTSAVTNATATVQAAYDSCKTAKTTWTTSVTSALGATLRPSDNDGD